MPIYKMEGKKNSLQKYRVRINVTDKLGKAKQFDRVAYGKDDAKALEIRLIAEYADTAELPRYLFTPLSS